MFATDATRAITAVSRRRENWRAQLVTSNLRGNLTSQFVISSSLSLRRLADRRVVENQQLGRA